MRRRCITIDRYDVVAGESGFLPRGLCRCMDSLFDDLHLDDKGIC